MTLYELIQSIPAAKAYADAGNISDCVRILNEKNQRGLIPISEITIWALLNGTAANIKKNALDANSQLYNVCYAADSYLNSQRFELIDLDMSGVAEMIEGLRLVGVFTQEQKNQLLAMGNNRVGIAFKTCGKDATINSVSDALAGGI